MVKNIQAEINIGVVGHVDHGKTSLTSKLTGKWTDKHSEEIKQGISIKLGYADAEFYKDPKLDGISAYTIHKVHPLTNNKTEFIKKVSFVDAPGHETLMAVMLSGATLLNGAILVVAANEECPQPRTIEHLLALKMHGIKNLVVAQNKIDLVSKEEALKNYQKLRKFLDDDGYKDAPIIPTSANFDTNLDALIYALLKTIPTPTFDLKAPLKMQIVRSFDINKPSTEISKLKGGILGGAILQGVIKVGDKVWVYPGLEKPFEIEVKSLNSGGCDYKGAHPGGLIAVGTDLDPFICNSDKMVGQIVCDPKIDLKLSTEIDLEYTKIERLIEPNKTDIKSGEKIVLVIGSSACLGIVRKVKQNNLELILNKPNVFFKNDKIAISRNINSRWRLAGYGTVK
ncbi:MAG: translation initiation factor IF-2 subunit gamma [archaeon]|nr:translation initiation factor IF-2 subunit gamma [archaeon]MDD2477613.1 translation initiation factor IF-2 subunit gamma [Candidatus ainarchaeum sp.]MDD3084292.1 translation initiation factor IF-2 subunit gamma [Candidatus ainarchaeum sp.]MDD4221033.1 translation initiation factor IF-2 subunit gamma [Candidatus ainarchaeum sp.]MDD4662505.1 translation initiation factor IF-2 subunit gamma [Candidatus ainarchaeum sp.]